MRKEDAVFKGFKPLLRSPYKMAGIIATAKKHKYFQLDSRLCAEKKYKAPDFHASFRGKKGRKDGSE